MIVIANPAMRGEAIRSTLVPLGKLVFHIASFASLIRNDYFLSFWTALTPF